MKKRKPFQVRQGDVLVMEVSERPAGAVRLEPADSRYIMALGEVTGHAHAIAERAVEAYAKPEAPDVIYLRIMAAPDLPAIVHEEHGAITLVPGKLQKRPQIEYAPAEMRRVAD
jgi:hypothetical protein